MSLTCVVKCKYCNFAGGGEGHVSRDCTQEAKAKSCYKCGQEGHIVSVRSLSPMKNTLVNISFVVS